MEEKKVRPQAVCKSKGIAMGTQITKMMKEFIDQSNKE